MKKIAISILVFLLISLIFFIPNILFGIQDIDSNKIGYIQHEKISQIDIQADDIYLIKLINEIEKGYLNIEIKEPQYIEVSTSIKTDIDGTKLLEEETELRNLEDAKVLKDIISKEGKLTIKNLEKRYKGDNIEYVIQRININYEGYDVSIEIEKKTNKILSISVPSEKIADYSSREIMENYIKYLGLYIIGDWKYENGSFKSEKAGLTVFFNYYHENNIKKIAFLSIHSTNNYYEIAN